MIDGIANYTGDPAVEAKCHASTAEMDAAIEKRAAEIDPQTDMSLIGAQMRAGLPMGSIQANVKLAISGGQNEPRDAIAGAAWALRTHPEQLTMVMDGRATWCDVLTGAGAGRHFYEKILDSVGEFLADPLACFAANGGISEL